MHAKKVVWMAALIVALPLAAQANQDLAKSKACLSCHSVDKKVIGPAFKDVAAKYKSVKGGDTQMLNSVLKGSTGKWGQMQMPVNQVTEAEAKTLVKWILSL